ncbi:hypothetical protein QNI16_27865 [Cytophagaceae bacterium YF14B1]|uniref:Uncharacterized protein n=1 Tax=Xanthocytophaga flava TaxID=3048013 RepID=A0AAE3QW82_9BACT|nr:hypothetical protein [Xanthocytophaga flavus]MDJ1484346.1 hypothetical protein [Xanthocytophaga flavus]
MSPLPTMRVIVKFIDWLLIPVWLFVTYRQAQSLLRAKAHIDIDYDFWEPIYLLMTWIEVSGYVLMLCLIIFCLHMVLLIKGGMYSWLISIIFSCSIWAVVTTTSVYIYYDSFSSIRLKVSLIHMPMHIYILWRAMNKQFHYTSWRLSLKVRDL